ncbi:hypothetical protein ABT168_17415 [Streptomyces sp. NPDC001793]|uniref:hypothetical protein n=1 Tax=Streptomyces sp. NPDC001793 TaxID=3154657 RepID=UPI003323F1B7
MSKSPRRSRTSGSAFIAAHGSVLLNANRNTVLKQILTIGLVIGVGYGIAFGLVNTALTGIGAGLVAGFTIALGAGTMAARGR